jgi:hypothetical protein
MDGLLDRHIWGATPCICAALVEVAAARLAKIVRPPRARLTPLAARHRSDTETSAPKGAVARAIHRCQVTFSAIAGILADHHELGPWQSTEVEPFVFLPPHDVFRGIAGAASLMIGDTSRRRFPGVTRRQGAATDEHPVTLCGKGSGRPWYWSELPPRRRAGKRVPVAAGEFRKCLRTSHASA